MADPSFRFVDGIAKNVNVQIDDHFIPTDFLVIDMGEDEYDPSIILGRPFLSTPRPSSTLQQEKYISNFPQRRYAVISIIII
jgi:hypothetical protein